MSGSILPDMLPVNPFKEGVTLDFFDTRCTNSVLPFTTKPVKKGSMKIVFYLETVSHFKLKLVFTFKKL